MGNPASAKISDKKIKLTIGKMVFNLDRDESLSFVKNLQTNARSYGFKSSEYFALLAQVFISKRLDSVELLLQAEYLLIATQLRKV